jgi:carbon monoxide dehydrogenase subunit G
VTTHVERSIEVDVPVSTVYDQWTQFEDFPRFMGGVQQVWQVGDTLTHWVAEIAGVRREWDAEIVEQVPDQKVAWAATTGATNAGAVYFDAVGADRTRVRLTLDFEPEGIVEKIGDVLDVVERQAVADLDRFKQFIEARGAATGGWRGTVHEGDAASSGETGVPGDVVAVGPTGDTRSTLETEAEPPRSGSVRETPDLGHSGDPLVVDSQASGHGEGERTGAAEGAATSAGVTGFGTDTGMSSSPTSGVLTGDPGATDERWAAAGGGPGEDRGAQTTAGEGVVQRDYADENLTTDDVVARDFADRDITGEGVVQRDFANRDITERDIAERGIEEHGVVTGMGGAHAAANPQADDPDDPIRPSV